MNGENVTMELTIPSLAVHGLQRKKLLPMFWPQKSY
jgi:hypothetical protein